MDNRPRCVFIFQAILQMLSNQDIGLISLQFSKTTLVLYIYAEWCIRYFKETYLCNRALTHDAEYNLILSYSSRELANQSICFHTRYASFYMIKYCYKICFDGTSAIILNWPWNELISNTTTSDIIQVSLWQWLSKPRQTNTKPTWWRHQMETFSA